MRGLNGFAWPATWMAVKRPLSAAVKRGTFSRTIPGRTGLRGAVWQDIPMKRFASEHGNVEEVAKALSCFGDRPILIAWVGRISASTTDFWNGGGGFPAGRRCAIFPTPALRAGRRPR